MRSTSAVLAAPRDARGGAIADGMATACARAIEVVGAADGVLEVVVKPGPPSNKALLMSVEPASKPVGTM